jgi:hypothetical protein
MWLQRTLTRCRIGAERLNAEVVRAVSERLALADVRLVSRLKAQVFENQTHPADCRARFFIY